MRTTSHWLLLALAAGCIPEAGKEGPGGDRGDPDDADGAADDRMYQGTLTMPFSAVAIGDDTCEGPIRLSHAPGDAPVLEGTFECTFEGSLSFVGMLKGTVTSAYAERDRYISGSLQTAPSVIGDSFELPWTGTFDGTTVAGTGSGVIEYGEDGVEGSDGKIDYELAFTAL
jgi:hypothetical protein